MPGTSRLLLWAQTLRRGRGKGDGTLKRIMSVLAVAILATVAFSGVALATHSNGNGPNKDFVTGSTRFPFLDAKVHINAMSGPSGEDPRGHFYINQESFAVFRGTVTCLNVVGNRAMVGGEVERSSPGFPDEGTGFLQLIVDNGEPGDSDSSETTLTEVPPTICPPPLPSGIPATRGNYVVHDATP